MDAEHIIKADAQALKDRHAELLDMFTGELDETEKYLLEELVLIELELKNRGMSQNWSGDISKTSAPAQALPVTSDPEQAVAQPASAQPVIAPAPSQTEEKKIVFS